MGGPSHEHDVSVKSGRRVVNKLHPEKYDVEPVFISREGVWDQDPMRIANTCDVAFIAMHGNYGEDGTVQSMLDEHGIPYTGSNAVTSAFAMNKYLSGEYFKRKGFATPLSFFVTKGEWSRNKTDVFSRIKYYLTFPFVVKPNDSGSSVGVSVVRNWTEFMDAMYRVFTVSDHALIQNYIPGREVSCAVLDRGVPGSEYALMPSEIIPRNNVFFDYEEKYSAHGSHEFTPARFAHEDIAEIQRVAVEVHRSIGAKGFSRTDMILDPFNTLFVLEINTIPGLTEQSLLPKAAAASNIVYSELLDRIIDAALPQE